MVACVVCGEENPERARFCLNCGTPLAALRLCERKGNTVLADRARAALSP
jgi:uncharacterized membrane protein YvbJ